MFWFVSKQFVSVVSLLYRTQRVSMFRLNRNKQKINRNSLTESIFCYFSENLGLFRSSLVFIFHWRRREEIFTTCLTSFLGSNCTSIWVRMEVTCGCVCHTVHTEWQWPLSGVHSIMMEKSAQPGECGECTAIPFHYIYHCIQSFSVRSSWEGRYLAPISTLLLYLLCGVGSLKIACRF